MFLYIMEDYKMLQAPVPPTQEDLKMIDEGCLTIVKVVDGVFWELFVDNTANPESGDDSKFDERWEKIP